MLRDVAAVSNDEGRTPVARGTDLPPGSRTMLRKVPFVCHGISLTANAPNADPDMSLARDEREGSWRWSGQLNGTPSRRKL